MLRWAFIGASTIAREFMLNAVRANGGVIAGIYSSSSSRGAEFASTAGIERSYASLQECLGDGTVDAVYISTTNELHAPQTIASAHAGKHVLCDKPLATTLEHAREMVDECQRAGVVLATNHHLPNAPSHRAIRGLLEQGAVGDIRAVRIFHARALPPDLQTWRTAKPEAGAGVILDVTVHDAALARFILREEITEVTAVSFQQGLGRGVIEDAVMGVMTSESGIPISFHDAWTVPHAGTGFEVHGSQASIIARDVMTSLPIGTVSLRRGDSIEPVDTGPPGDLYARAVGRFHDAVAGHGTPAVSGEDGLRALEVALAVARASRTGTRAKVA